MAELAQATVFEIDHPDSQHDKRERIGGLAPLAREVRFVPLDRWRLRGLIDEGGRCRSGGAGRATARCRPVDALQLPVGRPVWAESRMRLGPRLRPSLADVAGSPSAGYATTRQLPHSK